MEKILNVEMTKIYITEYKKRLENRIEFKKGLVMQNKNDNIEIDLTNNDPEAFIKQDYNWMVFNSIALEQKYSNNDDYSSIFLTITLDSPFHSHMQKGDKIVNNPKYIEGNTINLGYRILNDFFTSLYRNFKIDGVYEPIEQFRVIEPTKASFTPHLHAIIFVKKIHREKLISYIEKKIKKNPNLGKEYDIERIDNIKRTSAYILKYIQKNYEDEDMKRTYIGWRWSNKIRAYTFSKTYLNREIFDRISFHLKKDLYKDEDFVEYFGTDNYYKIVDMFTTINIETFDVETGEITENKKDSAEDDLFVVKIKRERYVKDDVFQNKITYLKLLTELKDIEIISKQLKKDNLYNSFKYFVFDITTLNDMNIEDNEYIVLLLQFLDNLKNTTQYIYKTISYQIYKKAPNNIARYDLVYDKKDWQLIES